jgi:hypothetical protein
MRRKNNVKVIRLLLFAFGLMWTPHQVSTIIFENLVITGSTSSCKITNEVYASYRSYFVVPVLTVIISITTMSVFGFYIYQHLQTQTLGENRLLSSLTRQLTKMALFQIASVLTFQVSYGIFTAYSVATTSVVKDAYRQAQESLASTFFSLYVYGLYTVKNDSNKILI